MIDPFNVTNYDRTRAEREEFALFAVAVAGKTAVVQAKAIERFMNILFGFSPTMTPFENIDSMQDSTLRLALRFSRIGQFNRLTRTFRELSQLNVFNCSVSDLEAVHGIGPKTARFFLMHSREDYHGAALDVHILRWLREERGHTDAPKVTPSAPKVYRRWESVYLQEAEREQRDPTELDLEIWSRYARTA